MKVTFKNKSNNGEKHVCDFCGKEAEYIWQGLEVEGQYCFTHYREMCGDVAAFDAWCEKFKEYVGENK